MILSHIHLMIWGLANCTTTDANIGLRWRWALRVQNVWPKSSAAAVTDTVFPAVPRFLPAPPGMPSADVGHLVAGTPGMLVFELVKVLGTWQRFSEWFTYIWMVRFYSYEITERRPKWFDQWVQKRNKVSNDNELLSDLSGPGNPPPRPAQVCFIQRLDLCRACQVPVMVEASMPWRNCLVLTVLRIWNTGSIFRFQRNKYQGAVGVYMNFGNAVYIIHICIYIYILHIYIYIIHTHLHLRFYILEGFPQVGPIRLQVSIRTSCLASSNMSTMAPVLWRTSPGGGNAKRW